MNLVMKILFVTQNLPYPTDAGDRLRTRNLIEILNSQYNLQCFFLPKGRRDLRDISAFKRMCPSNLYYTIVQPKIKSILFKGYEYYTDPVVQRHRVISGLKSILSSFRPDVVWLDYLFIGQYIPIIKSFKIPVIYGTHNSQSNLTRQLAQTKSNITIKLSLKLMSYLHNWHEKTFFNQADRLVCVSEQDKVFHQAYVPPEKIVIIPNFINLKSYDQVSPIKKKYPYICFVGSMDNIQNEKGIKYFISQIWDKIVKCAENVHLLIIGRGADKDKELISLVSSHKNIKIYYNVPSVIPFLKGALVLVVPLLHGSGTRLKVIESMACRKATVSTTIGAEGLGAKEGRDLLISDDPTMFAKKVVQLITNDELRRNIGESASQFAKERFSFEAVYNQIHQMISSII